MAKERKKFRDTAFGKILLEKAPQIGDVVADLLPDSGVLGVVKNLLDREDMDPGVRMELEARLREAENEAARIEAEDRASARNREVQVNQSEHASWLSKNVSSLLAISVTVLTFLFFYVVLFEDIDADHKDIVMFILGSLSSVSMQVIAYYFGSSVGSRNKENTIHTHIAKKN